MCVCTRVETSCRISWACGLTCMRETTMAERESERERERRQTCMRETTMVGTASSSGSGTIRRRASLPSPPPPASPPPPYPSPAPPSTAPTPLPSPAASTSRLTFLEDSPPAARHPCSSRPRETAAAASAWSCDVDPQRLFTLEKCAHARAHTHTHTPATSTNRCFFGGWR